jgi:hypothetical protein
MEKRGQITVFVIIAIFIVVAGSFYFIFKNSLKTESVPEDIAPIYSTFLSCLEEDSYNGISVLESTGGYINLPDFESGSRIAPFSSQLYFFGIDIPYWSYISASGLEREQVPSVSDMEEDLEYYLMNKIKDCDVNDYYDQGFEISRGFPEVDVSIRDSFVDVDLKMDLEVRKGLDVFYVSNFNSRVNSVLGELYDSALEVYEKEKSDLFLEEYSVDVLRLYAPVDGVEISCSPLTWNADSVFSDLKEAISSNILAIKNSGDSNDYFNVEGLPSSAKISFVNSENWPSYFEVNPSNENLLIAQPVGNQQGLGILGFCYVPYHFVYNLKYPVLVQLSKNGETFQFPLTVLIEGNVPREAKGGSSSSFESEDLCENSNSDIKVTVYDSDLNELEAQVSYECFGSTCSLGKTENGSIESKVPQCINGNLVVRSEGYAESQILHSSVDSGQVFVVLDKEYEKESSIYVDGKLYSGNAIITLVSEDKSQTISYPENKNVFLSEGDYEIEVALYEDTELNFDGASTQKCVDVPKTSLFGFFGGTKEQCYDVQAPEQLITTALVGGGSAEIFFSKDELGNSFELKINTETFDSPESLEDLQDNYILVELSKLEVELN